MLHIGASVTMEKRGADNLTRRRVNNTCNFPLLSHQLIGFREFINTTVKSDTNIPSRRVCHARRLRHIYIVKEHSELPTRSAALAGCDRITLSPSYGTSIASRTTLS
jgi:hypothetical protein